VQVLLIEVYFRVFCMFLDALFYCRGQVCLFYVFFNFGVSVLFVLSLVVSTSEIDCPKRLISEMAG